MPRGGRLPSTPAAGSSTASPAHSPPGSARPVAARAGRWKRSQLIVSYRSPCRCKGQDQDGVNCSPQVADVHYELRIKFDSPGQMGLAADAILPLLTTLHPLAHPGVVDSVAIENGEARQLNAVEDAAVEAGLDQKAGDSQPRQLRPTLPLTIHEYAQLAEADARRALPHYQHDRTWGALACTDAMGDHWTLLCVTSAIASLEAQARPMPTLAKEWPWEEFTPRWIASGRYVNGWVVGIDLYPVELADLLE
jgi:hypothetical protein